MSLSVTLRAKVTEEREVYARDGMTHNMVPMAEWAGIYVAIWRPEEIGIAFAGGLAPLLEAGLYRLEYHSEEARKLNPSNGWGDYEGFVKFVRGYLEACRRHPGATVEVSR